MTRPLHEYYPPLKERGMVELVGAGEARYVFSILVPTPSPAAAVATVNIVDAEGNAVDMSDALYVVIAQSEGQAATVVDESTKTTRSFNVIAGGNFTNPINVMVIGRGAKQPRTQL